MTTTREYPQTAETLAKALAAREAERAEIFRRTGIVIDPDGTAHLPLKASA